MANPSGSNPIFSEVNLSNGSVTAKLLVGSGAPAIAAPQGSMFLRTDGSSVSTRLYINTTGSTTWTAVTTVA